MGVVVGHQNHLIWTFHFNFGKELSIDKKYKAVGIPSTWPPPPPTPVDTGVPNGLLMLRNSLKDFAFEHRSGCCASEPGYAGDIGAIEI